MNVRMIRDRTEVVEFADVLKQPIMALAFNSFQIVLAK